MTGACFCAKIYKKNKCIHARRIMMDRMGFLLNITMAGIKNIEKQIRIDFYGKTINKKSEFEAYKIKGIYGENGSGKTAIITALNIVKEFVFDENYLGDYQNIMLLNDLINKKTKRFSFKCEFVTEIIEFIISEYEVSFVLNENGEVSISKESLKCKYNNNRNAQVTLFESDGGELKDIDADRQERNIIIDKTRNLLDKKSALALIANVYRTNINKTLPLSLLSANVFFMLLGTHFDREDMHTRYYQRFKLKNLLNNDRSEGGGYADSILEELYNDINANEKRVPIERIHDYEKKVKQLERFVRLFKPKLKKIDIYKKENKDVYECSLIMDYGTYRVDKEFESTGIKKIMDMFDAFVLASNGGIVFIDEMDSNINDVYLCKMLEYFKYYGKGQLCFTSHNTDPMDILKDSNKSIDFLTSSNKIVPWVKNGHYAPDNSYRNGMIEGMAFNIDASDFISVFDWGV